MTLSRGGMDIFWNHTIDQGLVSRFNIVLSVHLQSIQISQQFLLVFRQTNT